MRRIAIKLTGCFVLAIGLSVCSAEVEPTARAQIDCANDDECPGTLRCSGDGRCVDVNANQPPRVVLGSPQPEQGGRWLSTVRVGLSIADPNGAPLGRDTASVAFTWGSVDAASGEVAMWNPATMHTTSDPVVDLGGSNPAQGVTFVWDAVADLADTSGSYEADTDGDGAGDLPVVHYIPALRLRAVATDAAGASSAPVETTAFSLGDTLPEVALGEFAPPLSGAIPIAITVSDGALDPVTVELQFRADPFSTWEVPEISFGNLAALPSSVTGLEHVVVWDSAASIGGIGAETFSTVQLRARALGEPLTGVANYGAWSDPINLPEVQNQTAPFVAELLAPRADSAGGASPITIHYRVVDAESDSFDARFEYSLDGGGSYVNCKEFARFPSQGRTDLVAAPDNPDRSGGVWHAFVWDPTGIVLSPTDTTRLRVSVSDRSGQATSVETGLGYSVGPTDFSENYAVYEGPAHVGTDAFAESLASGDFDGDGITDFLVGHDYRVTSPGDVRLRLLTGGGATPPGDGTLAASDGPLTSWGVADVQVADVNGDGDDDIAVVESLRNFDAPNDGDARLTVFLGDGDGGFEAAWSTGVIAWARSLRLGHLNEDADLDAVVSAAGVIHVFAGNGDGTFGAADVYTTGSINHLRGPDPLAIADLDSDGDQDIAAIRYGGNEVDILLNDGSGSYAYETSYVVGELPAAVLAADFNRDGLMDLVTANQDDATVSALLGAGGSGASFFEPPVAYAVGLEPRGMGLVDVNHDALPDLAVANQGSNNVALLVGLGGSSDGLFGAPTFYPTGDAPISVAVAPVDGDGLDDLLVGSTNGYNNGAYLLRSQLETAVASFSQPVASLTALAPYQVVAADFHHDGVSDLATAGGPIGIHDGLAVGWGAQGDLAEARSIDVHVASAPFYIGSIDAADLNGDGITDIAAAQSGVSGVQVYVGTGTDGIGDGDFSPGPLLTWSICGWVRKLFLEDFDRSGRNDIAVVFSGCGHDSSVLWVFLSNGEDAQGMPTYGEPLSVELGIFHRSLTVGDFNGDGWLDLASATQEGDDYGILVSLNDLTNSGIFLPPQWLSTSQSDGQNNTLCSGDFNNDAHTDVAVAGRGDVMIAYGYGDGSLVQGPSYSPSSLVGSDELEDIICVDFNRDGILDLLVAHPARSQVIYYQGSGAAGAGDGTFVETAAIPVGVGVSGLSADDMNDDGLLDILTSVPSVIMGQLEDRTRSWGRRLVPFEHFPTMSDARQAYLFGRDLNSPSTTLFGDRSDDGMLAQHALSVDGGWLDHLPANLALDGVTVAGDLLPVTLPWQVHDPSRFDVVLEQSMGLAPLGDGVRLCTSAEPYELDGPEPSGIVVELPVLAGRNATELAGEIRVFHRRERLVRTSDVPSDPAFGHHQEGNCLPEISDAIGVGRTVIKRQTKWVEIPVDDDLDFRTGSSRGARFIVDPDPSARNAVWVLTDTFGVFQAVVSPP